MNQFPMTNGGGAWRNNMPPERLEQQDAALGFGHLSLVISYQLKVATSTV
jgi:hypothetical protein